MDISEKQKQRFILLDHLYKITNGSSSYVVNQWELGEELKLDRETTRNITDYLQGEGLVEAKTLGGGISITHYGIVEIEEAYEKPNDPTDHFQAINIVNVGTMTNSSIQQGASNKILINDLKNEDVQALKLIIEELSKIRDKVEFQTQIMNEFDSELETLKSQSKSPKPKKIIITESLRTIREILQGLAVNTMTPRVLELIQQLIG